MSAGEVERVYLWVPRWGEFQHYKTRDPVWIKVYPRLLSDDSFLGLTTPQKGVLLLIWLAFARSGCRLPIGHSPVDNPVDNLWKSEPDTAPIGAEYLSNTSRKVVVKTSELSRIVGERIDRRSIESLYHAGFIEFVASETLAERLQDASVLLAQSREEKSRTPQTPHGAEKSGAGGLGSRGKGEGGEGGHDGRREGRGGDAEPSGVKVEALRLLVRSTGRGYPDRSVLVDELTDRGLSREVAEELVHTELGEAPAEIST